MSSYHFLLGPLVAAAAMGLLVLTCRWVFSTTTRDERTARRLERAAATRDYGLLVPVARVRTAEDAQMLRTVLAEAGLRASVSAEGEDHAVLVFAADAPRARALVASPG